MRDRTRLPHRPGTRQRMETQETDTAMRLSADDLDRLQALVDAARAVIRSNAIGTSNLHAAIDDLESALRQLPGGW